MVSSPSKAHFLPSVVAGLCVRPLPLRPAGAQVNFTFTLLLHIHTAATCSPYVRTCRCCPWCKPLVYCCDACCCMKNIPREFADLPDSDGHIVKLTTKTGHITHMWCHERPGVRTQNDDSRFDLIYSHGRMEDMTFPPIRMFLRALSRRLKINCYLYEWLGFAQSSGVPSAAGANEALEAALEHVMTLGTNNYSLLMGHSLGGGPTVHLAAQHWSRDKVAGVILKSTFTSVCGALACPCSCCCCCVEECHRCCCAILPCCDTFRNLDLISQIEVGALAVCRNIEVRVVPGAHVFHPFAGRQDDSPEPLLAPR